MRSQGGTSLASHAEMEARAMDSHSQEPKDSISCKPSTDLRVRDSKKLEGEMSRSPRKKTNSKKGEKDIERMKQ